MSSKIPERLLVVATAVALLAGACGGSDSAVGVPATPTPPVTVEPTEIPTATPLPDGVVVDETDLSVKPVVTVDPADAPEEVRTDDIVIGGGPDVIGEGDVIIVNYVGVSYVTGLEFDSSWSREATAQFTVGENLIDGFSEGLVGMQVGGRRRIDIPSELAYGESASADIGDNADLVFVVDVLAFVDSDASKPTITIPPGPATELSFTDQKVGAGRELQTGDRVRIHYVGAAQSTGDEFDASWDRGPGALYVFTYGLGFVLPGLDEGMAGMRVGGRRLMVIPPDLAFGELSAGSGVIPPNETLVFVIDLVFAEEQPEADATPGADATPTTEPSASPEPTPAGEVTPVAEPSAAASPSPEG